MIKKYYVEFKKSYTNKEEVFGKPFYKLTREEWNEFNRKNKAFRYHMNHPENWNDDQKAYAKVIEEYGYIQQTMLPGNTFVRYAKIGV